MYKKTPIPIIIIIIFILFYPLSSQVEWTKTFGGKNYDIGYDVKQTSDGGYIITGKINLGNGNIDVYLIKTGDFKPYQKKNDMILKSFFISPNYPNPFNSSTTIMYEIKEDNYVTISIYNVLGEKIITLTQKEHPAGDYEISWDGRDDNGNEVSSGIYFCRIRVKGLYTGKTIKMALIR